jgi:hypothetical protein
MAQKQAARADQAKVVNGHHHRNILSRALREDGRGDQGEQVVDVDHVRARFPQKPSKRFSGKGIVMWLARNKPDGWHIFQHYKFPICVPFGVKIGNVVLMHWTLASQVMLLNTQFPVLAQYPYWAVDADVQVLLQSWSPEHDWLVPTL